MGAGGQCHALAALPPGKTQYPFYRRLGEPQGWSGRVRKILPPPGFDPQTVQPIASGYTDRTIPPHVQLYVNDVISLCCVFICCTPPRGWIRKTATHRRLAV